MQQNNAQALFSPNKDDMRKHIEFLMSGMDDYRDGKIEIAYGNDKNEPTLAEKFSIDREGDIDDIIAFAIDKNTKGRNVYVVGSYLLPTVPPAGRSNDAMFYATNSLWVDIDNDGERPVTSAELKMKYAHCPPNMVVVTGRTPQLRTWLWWKLREPITKPEEIETALTGIIQSLDGDPSAKNPTRLTRFGGSISWPTDKKAARGRITEIVETKIISDTPVSLELLSTAYPLKKQAKPKRESVEPHTSFYERRSNEEIADMLAQLDADMHRKEWVEIGMALHDEGYPLELWDQWSATGKKYVTNDCATRWRSFKQGGGISMGSFVQKVNGWVYPRKPVKHEPLDKTEIVEKPIKNKPHYNINFDGLIGDTVSEILATSEKPLPELAILNTIAALGAVFGRRYAGPQNTRTNIYMVGIAPTGAGKDHSRQFIKTLMFKAGLSMYIGPDRFISGAGLMTSLSKQPSQISHPDEFGMMLQEMSNKLLPHTTACSRIITELYSSSKSIFKGGQYADKDEEPIDIIYPNLCIYGTTTLKKYAEAMNSSFIHSGELNRFLVLQPENPHPTRVFLDDLPPAPSTRLIKKWEEFVPLFKMNSNLDASAPTVVKNPEKDRINTIKLFMDKKVQADSPTAPLWARYAEHVVKISMIQAITRDPVIPEIRMSDIEAAEALVMSSIEFMEDIAENHIADTEDDRIRQKIKNVIKHNETISSRELQRKMKIKSKLLQEFLLDLQISGEVEKISLTKNSGQKTENWKINLS